MGRALAAVINCRFGVRFPAEAGVMAPLPAPAFLALFLAVVALRLDEDDQMTPDQWRITKGGIKSTGTEKETEDEINQSEQRGRQSGR